MEPYWDPNSHGAPHAVKYESDTTVSGFAYCNEGGLNFAASAASAYSEDDADFGSGRRGKASRQDPLSHRIIEKRRRDRMNSCLADLSRLIPPQYQRKGRGRIEKTEIIEMSIRYMKQLQHQEYLHKENLYKLGYEECLQQAANYLYTGHHRDICYQMVDHLKEVLKGDCLKIRIHNSALDSVSASSGSPPSSHHHLNGAFHPVAPLSQLREMLTASDTEHSSDLHDLHDGQHSDDAGGEMPHLHPHHQHLHNSLHEDAHDGHGHHVPQMQAQMPQPQQQQQPHQVPQQQQPMQQQAHTVPKPVPEQAPALSMHDDDDVKDLSLRRCPQIKPLSVALTPSPLAISAAPAMLVSGAVGAAPTDSQQVQSQSQQLQPCKRPSSVQLHHPMDGGGQHPADFGSPHQHQHLQPQPQRLLLDCSTNSNGHHNSRSPPLPSPRPASLTSNGNAGTTAAAHIPQPPSSASSSSLSSTPLGAPHRRHHDLRPPHDADDDPEPEDLHDDELAVPGRARQRKLSHDTTATCAHDIHDHHHSYKFKNYIQQRFSQDTHTNDLSSRSPSPLGLGDGGGGSSKKPKLCMDFEQSVSCDEKPSVNGDCKPEVSAFPMFKTMQQPLMPLVASAPLPPPSFALLSAAKSAAGQMVPIFALHSHGRFYVPLSVEYAALQPYLGGIDLLLDGNKPASGLLVASATVPVSSSSSASAVASAAASVIQPPLHSINISVNFAAVGGTTGAGASMLRPKMGVGLQSTLSGTGIGVGGTLMQSQTPSVVQGIGSDGW